MGKTFRFDDKYRNKHEEKRQEQQDKDHKKSKRFLKGHFLQRFWPLTNEKFF